LRCRKKDKEKNPSIKNSYQTKEKKKPITKKAKRCNTVIKQTIRQTRKKGGGKEKTRTNIATEFFRQMSANYTHIQTGQMM